jgi:hypothetical protein
LKSDNVSEEEDDSEYEIDHIVGYRIKAKDDTIEFLVRWKGYGPNDDTWESFDMFAHDAPDIVKKYLVEEVFKKNDLPMTSQN